MRLGLLLALMVPLWVGAVGTELEVRVLAKDAKFIGSGMGGMAVTVRDFATGKGGDSGWHGRY